MTDSATYAVQIVEPSIPRRLAEAPMCPEYAEAMQLVPSPRTSGALVGTLLAGATFGVMTCFLVVQDIPFAPALVLATNALAFAILTGWGFRYWRTLRRGPLHRELVAVLEVDTQRFHEDDLYFMTLWNHERPPQRLQLELGFKPHIARNDIAVAIFRGDLLVGIVPIPV